MPEDLPMPRLSECERGGIALITDDNLFESTGVRMAFTERVGGVSARPYASLNLATHVEDDCDAVTRNREILLAALGAQQAALVVPNQVHGTELVSIASADAACVAQAEQLAAEGADGVLVSCENVAALLCFADCMPVVVVAPGGRFTVVHAGWRGVYARIAVKAVAALCELAGCEPSQCNVYLGPYIHAKCFEVGEDLERKFAAEFGQGCIAAPRHVDLGWAMRESLLEAGVDPLRIADADACTVCNNERFFSYRAEGGVCGRHGAIAVRI